MCCAILMMFVLWRTDWVAQVERAKDLTTASQPSPTTILPLAETNINNNNKKMTTSTVCTLDQILCANDHEFGETDPLVNQLTNSARIKLGQILLCENS